MKLGTDYVDRLPELAILVGPDERKTFSAPETILINSRLAEELQVDIGWLKTSDAAQILTGNRFLPNTKPAALKYAGHQFGFYSSLLGDGRALLLGEIHGGDGKLHDLHLKGSGPTKLSRGDGFAALGPMLREYLMGEAMHALGIPTTRALAVSVTGNVVARDGDLQPGAVLARVASSHIRVGTFQYARQAYGEELVTKLLDYSVSRHFPEMLGEGHGGRDLAVAFFREVLRRQAVVVAKWMTVGFVHGVMNTDNMAISGQTIDYGPCAFLDAYNPLQVYSSIDRDGRYAYGQQPLVAKWNLARLVESLLHLLSDDEAEAIEVAKSELGGFDEHYERALISGFASKLGLEDDSASAHLIKQVLAELERYGLDLTQFFVALTADAGGQEGALESFYGASKTARNGVADMAPGDWYGVWKGLAPDKNLMERSNPYLIPRNFTLEAALEKAEAHGDLSDFLELLRAVQDPFVTDPQARKQLSKFAYPELPPHRFVSYCGT